MKKGLKNIVLPVLCLIVSFLVSLSFQVTAPVIAANNEEKANELRKQVLPNAESFEQVSGDFKSDLIKDPMVYVAKDGSAAITVSAAGYGGKIQVMVGILPDGKVNGIRILASSETPGVGKRTEEEEFTSQFIGVSSKVSVGKEIDKITGATISSKAMTNAVNGATEIFSEIGGEKK